MSDLPKYLFGMGFIILVFFGYFQLVLYIFPEDFSSTTLDSVTPSFLFAGLLVAFGWIALIGALINCTQVFFKHVSETWKL